MSRSTVIPALVLVAGLGLAGCSAGASVNQDANATGPSDATSSSDAPDPTDAPSSSDATAASEPSTSPTETGQGPSQNSEEVVAAISQADAEMKLGFDLAALDAAAEWTGAMYVDQGDGTRYMSLQASRDQLAGILAWVDAQDWDGWLIQDTEPDAEATGKFRFLNQSSFTLQELLGDLQSVDVQFFDAE